jgi:ABC-2 type transport system ATP-binding protein
VDRSRSSGEAAGPTAPAAGPVVETVGLTRYYGRTVGVEDLDLRVPAGEVFGLLGPNGSGKTTTIRLLLDLVRPSRGEARLFGRPSSVAEVRGRVGYLPGELVLDGRMTGRATLGFLGRLDPARGRGSLAPRRDELCERLGLSAPDLRRPVRQYSRGMKQKLGLVAAFQHDPDLLILDEPTTALDPLVREVVFDLMAEARARGVAVFHSSHVLSEVDRTCERVAFLRDGRLAALMPVEEVRRAGVRRMVVHFAADPPLAELRIPGVETESVEGGRVVLRVRGGLDPLLATLARHPVGHLTFPEPGLEEAFTAFYRGADGGAVGPRPLRRGEGAS